MKGPVATDADVVTLSMGMVVSSVLWNEVIEFSMEVNELMAVVKDPSLVMIEPSVAGDGYVVLSPVTVVPWVV